MTDKQDIKLQIANDVLSMHTPHMSSQLGANLGYGVNAFAVDRLQDINDALKLWFKEDNTKKLIGTIMASEALGVITIEQADEIIQKIKATEQKG